MTELEKLVNEYLDYLEIEKNRSIHTRKNYARYLHSFLQETGIKKPEDISEEKVRRFRLALARRKNALQKNTQSYYIIALRNFLKYLIKRDYTVLAPGKIELPKLENRQIILPHYNEFVRLLDGPKGNNLRGARDKAILEIFFSTGLRLAELCALGRFLDFKHGEISVKGKGGKIRVVFLSKKAVEALEQYLALRDDADEALFISLTRAKKPRVIGRVTPRAVERLIDYYAKKVGITERVTPHQLRHLFATDLLMNGADLRSVQELLGHAHIGTTQIYTHLTNTALKEVHRAFHAKRR